MSNNTFDGSRLARKSKIRIIVQAHCGRKKNTKRELTVTLSHLLAIRTAIYGDFPRKSRSRSTSPYALILEDDLQLAFEVDFAALIRSSPNPKTFGILQLVTSNDFSVMNLEKVFLHHRQLWVKRKDKDDYWCAGAYIINKPVLKPFIDAIFNDLFFLDSSKTKRRRGLYASPVDFDPPPPTPSPSAPNSSSSSTSSTSSSFSTTASSRSTTDLSRVEQRRDRPWAVKVLAGYQAPCWPKLCCKGSLLKTGNGSACVLAARGYRIGPLHLLVGLGRDVHAHLAGGDGGYLRQHLHPTPGPCLLPCRGLPSHQPDCGEDGARRQDASSLPEQGLHVQSNRFLLLFLFLLHIERKRIIE